MLAGRADLPGHGLWRPQAKKSQPSLRRMMAEEAAQFLRIHRSIRRAYASDGKGLE
jgi:hypothetical protein